LAKTGGFDIFIRSPATLKAFMTKKRPHLCAPANLGKTTFKCLLLAGFLCCGSLLHAQVPVGGRVVTNFNQSWKFQLGDYSGAQAKGYGDALWSSVGLPHSFDAPYFGYNQFYSGYGWYRKHFTVTTDWTGKRVFLEFEAAFQDAQVYVNGQLVGEHLGGYTGFSYDVTANVVVGDNVVAVRLNNNWNPQLPPRGGDHTFIGGLYRNVWLVATDPVHVTWFGTWVTTPTLAANSGASSTVNIQTEIRNDSTTNVSCAVKTDILDANSNLVTTVSSTQTVVAATTNTFNQTTPAVSNPNLWSPSTPNLYRAVTTVFNGTNIVDSYTTSFGFRWIQWTAANGFFLNGAHLYFHGADVHQDHAGWSDGIADSASARDVSLIKQTGLNFIRGSHYPHSTAFVNACDTNGICLWSEFPFWAAGNDNGETVWNGSAYPTVATDQAPFEANVHQGLTEEIRILRNHPSIIVWSMSNEPYFSASSVFTQMTNLLGEEVAWTHQLDPTRPAAIGGCQRPKDATRIDKIGDVAGYNGDGASIGIFQNPGIPSMVTEYGSVKSYRPGAYDPGWGNSLNLTGGLPTEYAWRSGQCSWCGFDYGTVLTGGCLPGGSGTMGMVDFFRIPKRAWYWYRNQYAGVPPPAWPGGGTPAQIQLTTDTTNFTAVDGTQDAQLLVTVLDAYGNPTSNNVPVTLTIISGPGQFPTGTNIAFTPQGSGQASDIAILEGKAAIEFRTYYSGTSVIQATSPGLTSASVTITSQGSPAWVPGVTPPAPTRPYSRFNGTITLPPAHSYLLALNHPTAVSSTGAGSSANVDDGDTNTLWQAAATDTNAWWQIDLENIYQLDSVQLIFPAPGNYHYQIQLSGDKVNWTTAVDESQNSSSEQSRTAVGNFGGGIQYLRVQFTNMPAGLTPGLAEVVVGGGSGLTYPAGQLSGTIIGTDGSSNNVAANVKESSMDWNTNTFFDAPDGSGDWVGLDLGSSVKTNIVQVGYCPRVDSGGSSFSSRMVGGVFQGANQPDFSDATNLFTIISTPAQGAITLQSVSSPTAFRYVRYVSPAGGFCNVSELEFFPGAVVVVSSVSNTVWSGSVNGTWDTTTANWVTNGVAAKYQDGVTVQFDDSASGNTTVSASATRTPGAMVVSNAVNNYSIGGSAIAGTGSLTKSGAGTLMLTAANTFSGNITINNGTLAAATTVNVAAGNAGPLGNGSINTRTITANGPGVLDFQINNTLGQLGPGKNTSPPAVVISGGTLKVEKVSNLVGAIVLNGGTINANAPSSGLNYKPSAGYLYSYLSFQLGGDVTVGGSAPSSIIASQTSWDGISLNNTKTTFNVADATGDSNVDLTVSCAVGDVNADYGGTKTTCQLVKAGSGTMLLSGLNFYDGGTVVSAGTLIVGNADNQTIPVINGSTAQANSAGALGKPSTAVTLGDANTTANNSSPALMIGGAFAVGHPITIASQATSGAYTLGGSTDNSSAFTNLVTVNEPLTVSQAANTGANALTFSGGITSGGGAQTLTFAGPGNINVTNTAISNGSGTLAVSVTGGTLRLNTANTHTGATTVTNGTLLVGGSVAAGSALTVQSGGVLGGSGIVNGPAIVQSGGTLSPGGSLSTLTFGNALTLAPGSASFFEISKSPLTNDVAKVAGALTCGGRLIVTNISGLALAIGDSFKLFNAGSYSGAFANVQLPPLPAGLAWNTSALNTGGILSVVVKPYPVVSSARISVNGLVFSGNSGVGYASYYLLGSTNLATPVTNWTRLLTNQFDAGGNFNFTNPMAPSAPQSFYQLQIP
jgi:autotransporter-associated beta strand protein